MNSLSSSLNARASLDRTGGPRTINSKIPNSDVLGELYGDEFDRVDFDGRYLGARTGANLLQPTDPISSNTSPKLEVKYHDD